MTTSARARSSTPGSVMRSGSPGPAPTRNTWPALIAANVKELSGAGKAQGQVRPHTDCTSLTQMPSHAVPQQYGSAAQMSATQPGPASSQPLARTEPSSHGECEQLPWCAGQAYSPHTVSTSPTQMPSQAVSQQ